MTARTGSLITSTVYYGNFSHATFSSYITANVAYGNFSHASFANYGTQATQFYPATQSRNGAWALQFIAGTDVAYSQGVSDGTTSGLGAGLQAAAAAYDDGEEDGFIAGLQAGIPVGEEIAPPPPTPLALRPVITILTPLPPATATTPIVVTIVGAAGVPIRRAWIDAVFPGIVGTEVVHNGDRFGAYYTNGINSRVAFVDGFGRIGYQYTFLRDGGWPVGSFPLVTSFDISAVDTIGNGT